MKSLKFYIAILFAFLIVYLIAQYNRPKEIDWSQTLDTTDKIPFGTYVLYHRLNDIFPQAKIVTFREPVYNVLTDHHVQNGTYLIVCDALNLNEYDYSKLKKYISDGNDVFVAATYFGDQLRKDLKIESSSEYKDTLRTQLRFVNIHLDTTKKYMLKKGMSDGYFQVLDTAKAVVLGVNNYHHANFLKYTFGKGHLFLNANPLMFTNYSLLNNSGVAYAATALSFVKNESNLIWDLYYTLGRDDDGSTMRVFLRSPVLRFAFYIAFFGLLAFVIYEMKRRQRIIPVIEPLRNSSVDFVNVVGQVYYEQRNNSNIAQKKAVYFLEYLRAKYNLKTSLLNDEFATALSQKTGVELALLQSILNQVTLVRSGIFISDQDLITFNQNIEQFYKQSR